MNLVSENLKAGSIVQLDPVKTETAAFAGCLLVVTQVKGWGVEGYVQGLGESRSKVGDQFFYRAEHGSFADTGGVVKWSDERDEHD